MLQHPPEHPDHEQIEQTWRKKCQPADVEILENANRTLAAMMHPDDGQEADFHSVWIGLLLGAGVVESWAHADEWATFVRYNTDLIG